MFGRVVADASQVEKLFGSAARAMPAARRALFLNLAGQTYKRARKLAKGPSIGPRHVKRGQLQGAGNYPIPIRDGKFFNAFGFAADANGAVVWNDRQYARPLHDGFRPYGNPHARPIRARTYYDDALDGLDMAAAQAAFEGALP